MIVAETLAAAYASLANVIKLQTAAWEAAGCPPTFSVDGESYDWNNWLTGKIDALDKLRRQISAASGPTLVRTFGRA